jgi:glycosyltransferase involved in cell wall biosynthesis
MLGQGTQHRKPKDMQIVGSKDPTYINLGILQMKIINAMFSTAQGGVEQVFLNYTMALEMEGHQVISIIHPWAAIKKYCSKPHLRTIYSFGRNDFIASYRLRQLINKEQPDCIITHTKRAAFLLKKAQCNVPIVGVCHTPQLYTDLERNSDAVITITKSMYQEIHQSGMNSKEIYAVPNMVQFPKDLTYKEPQLTEVPVIGVSARFSNLKGIEVFIDALAELKRRKIAFKAKIAGDGKQKKHYIKQVQRLSLHKEVDFLGWVDNKSAFYNSLNIFCHPSLKESFGLVVVESMMHSLPLVITDTSGPLEIIGDSECAVIVPISNAISLANGLERVINEPNFAREIAQKAFYRAKNYSINQIAPALNEAISNCVACYKS